MDRWANANKIADFIAEFGGDVDSAINALTAYKLQVIPGRQVIPSDKPILLRVENVSKTYKISKVKVEALSGVSLDIRQGEFVAITGESGSGKSTLLQLLGGLDRPSDGNVFVGDTNLRKLSDSKLSEFRGCTIGFVFQSFYLQPFLKLSRNIEVVGMFARTPRKLRADSVRRLAERVGLGDRLNHYSRELSGGQLQRAAIARALLNSPKVILADEPTGNLDSENSRSIIDLFESIRHELGTTIVIVTHDRAIASRADRIINMRDGRIV
ncbi:MAG: ABC transporter ATP-binding protein [Candidatus Saccharimonas sp.]